MPPERGEVLSGTDSPSSELGQQCRGNRTLHVSVVNDMCWFLTHNLTGPAVLRGSQVVGSRWLLPGRNTIWPLVTKARNRELDPNASAHSDFHHSAHHLSPTSHDAPSLNCQGGWECTGTCRCLVTTKVSASPLGSKHPQSKAIL